MYGIDQFQLTYELCPIILEGGIANSIPGAQLPIISLIQAQSFTGGILQDSDQITKQDFFAHFTPLPGATLIESQVGMYPFANQAIAANAVIAQPLKLSMRMTAPAPTPGGYPLKLAAFSSLQQQLGKHRNLGGTFTVATPAMYYTNMILEALRDVTGGSGVQVQVEWQWDFIKPLLTQEQAAQAYSSLISKLDGRLPQPTDPLTYSSAANAVGNPGSGIAPALIPAAQQVGAASVPFGGIPTNPGTSTVGLF